MSSVKKKNVGHSVHKSKPDMIAGDLDAVVGDVAAFLRPVLEALLDNSSFELVWVQGGPYHAFP